MVDLASLVVKLQMQTAEFIEGARRGEEAIKSLSETVSDQVGEMVKKFLELEALKKAFEFTSELAEQTTKLAEMSKVLGLTADELARLQFAAKLSGVDDIVRPIERMARAAGEATEGNVKLLATFQQFGISQKDIQTLSTEKLFEKLADGVAKYGDSLEKVRGVQQILGRASAEDIALLDKGAEGLKQAGQEAEAFGLGLSQDAAEGVVEFHKDLERLSGIIDGVFRQALSAAAPYLTKFIDSLVEFFKENRTVVFDTISQMGEAIGGLGETLKPVIDLVIASYNLLKAIADPIIHEIGPALEVNGKAIAVILEELAHGIDALSQEGSLFKEFADEVLEGLQLIGTALLTIGTTVEVVTRGIQGAFEVYDLYQQIPSRTDFLIHPIDSTNKFLELQKEAQVSVQKTADDINASFDRGDVQLDKLWGNASKAAKGYGDVQLRVFDIQKQLDEDLKSSEGTKPAFHGFDVKGFEEFQKIIGDVLKQTQKLEEQVNTFGLGSGAAAVYDATFGHIADQLTKIDTLSKSQQLNFLDLAKATHQISADDFNKLADALKRGVSVTQELRQAYIDAALKKEALANVDSILKLDESILKLSGHEKEAAEAASLLANRQLEASLQQQAAVQALSGLSGSDKVVEAQSRINALQEQATGILHKYESAASEANSTDEKTQSAAIATRTVALAQLEELYLKMRALANASGDPALIKQAQALQDAFTKSANSSGEADIEAQKKRNTELAEYNDLQKQAQAIQTQLADQLAQINDLQAQGGISELDSQEKQDEARQKAIDQLEQIHEKMGEIAADSDNPAIKDGFTKMGTSVTQLHTQLNQLGKSIRDDFVNESSSAFSDFVLGTKSASAAAKEFLQGIESDLIRLINKHLFEQLFEGSFGGSPGGGVGGSGFNIGSLLSLFGGGAGVGASADALATSTLADYSSSFALAEIALAEGGPVRKGQEYLVGEEGPELLLPVDGSMPKLLGLNGPMHIRAEEPGTVVPHDLTKQLVPDVANDKKPSDKHSLQPTNLFDMPEVAKAEYRELSSASQQVLKDHKIIHPEDQGLTPATVDYSSSFAYAETPPSKLAEGGAVTKGQEYLVGEEGPELLLPDDGGMPKLLGLNGPTHIRAKEPGTVVPHDLTEQLVPDAVNDKKPSDKHSIQPAALFDMPEVARAEYRELSSASQQVLKDHKIIHPEDQGLTPATTDYSSSSAYTPSELAKGGPVRKGQEYLVAEEGPELLIPDYGGMPKLLGLNGPTHIRAEEPGTVVPHDLTEQLVPDAGNGKKPSDKYSIPPSKLFDMPEAAKLEYRSLSDASQQFNMLKDHEIVLPESYELPSELSVEPAKTHRVPQYLAGMLPHYDAFYQLERRGSGGGVNSDQPYLVGEYGPEVMVPATSGTVVPNDAIQGKTISVTNNFQISAPTGTVSRATQSQIAANAARAVQMANHRNN
jgi:hypothetical protein